MKIVITVEVPDGAAVDVGTESTAAPVKATKSKAKAAPESAPPVATPVPASEAPAPAPATVPVASTITKEQLKKAILAVAGVNREAAVKILAKHGTTTAATLPPEKYQAVFDDFEEEKARLDAALAQASLV